MNLLQKNNWTRIAVTVMVVVYAVGITGILSANENTKHFFLSLTPLNLFLTTVLILSLHKEWNRNFILVSLFIFLAGYSIEVIGVRTGDIFGDYVYGEILGVKLWNVPLVIGLNWFLLVYTIGTAFYKLENIFLFAITGAAVMTLLDCLIEPVAVRLDFWRWQNGVIPFRNYAAWFILSFLFFLLFRITNGKISNRISWLAVLIQFLFFGLLNILLP